MNGNDIQLKDVSQRNDHGVDNSAFERQEDDHNDDIEKEKNAFSEYIGKVSKSTSKVSSFFKSHTQTIKYIVRVLLAAGFLAYFVAACVLDFDRALALVILTSVVVFFKLYGLIKRYKGDSIKKCFKPAGRCFKANLRWLKWVFIMVVLGLLVAWLAVDTSKRPEQLISFGGIGMIIVIFYILSVHKRAVSWRAVFWGLGLQFVIGLFVMRTEPGLIATRWLGEQFQTFLKYSLAGSSFVFGDELVKQVPFAFQTLPIVVFFSSVMSVLYYLGLMQWLLIKIAWVMQITMGTSPTETLSVAGNIFFGQTEAPLLIRPYLPDMTKSEIHAVMTGGFATIAGSMMGGYISLGIDASTLISASVMAAPCALALAKLSYPETEESKFKTEEEIKMGCGGEQNLLEAASNGASASIGLVANIAVNMIAFLAILEFVKMAVSWLGGNVGYPEIPMLMILSNVFMPISFMMGIPYEEAYVAGDLIGRKMFLNEFMAYERLSELKANRLNGLPAMNGTTVQWISPRSEVICTFAIGGPAHLGTLGIVIGVMSSICPSRRGDITDGVMPALVTGMFASMLNACVAGILYVPQTQCVDVFRNADFNCTFPELTNCCSDLFKSSSWDNGIAIFTGTWSLVQNATLYLNNCCGLYNNTLCL